MPVLDILHTISFAELWLLANTLDIYFILFLSINNSKNSSFVIFILKKDEGKGGIARKKNDKNVLAIQEATAKICEQTHTDIHSRYRKDKKQ